MILGFVFGAEMENERVHGAESVGDRTVVEIFFSFFLTF